MSLMLCTSVSFFLVLFVDHLKDRKVKKNYPAGFSMSLAYILSPDSKTVLS